MKQVYPVILKNLLIFSLILGGILWGFCFVTPSRYLTPTLPYQFVFFFALTTLVTCLLIRVSSERFNKFLNTYLLITTVKLLLFFALIAIYIYWNRSDAAPFTIWFFVLYLCFSAFEVISLVTYSKKSQH